jgi:hypothetical protein
LRARSSRAGDACWRAAKHLSEGQIHLLDNPPLHEKRIDVKHQPES